MSLLRKCGSSYLIVFIYTIHIVSSVNMSCHGNYCLWLSTKVSNWVESQENCATDGGALMTFRNDDAVPIAPLLQTLSVKWKESVFYFIGESSMEKESVVAWRVIGSNSLEISLPRSSSVPSNYRPCHNFVNLSISYFCPCDLAIRAVCEVMKSVPTAVGKKCFGSSCFSLVGPSSWKVAQQECSSAGGKLVPPADRIAEYDFVWVHVLSLQSPHSIWMNHVDVWKMESRAPRKLGQDEDNHGGLTESVVVKKYPIEKLGSIDIITEEGCSVLILTIPRADRRDGSICSQRHYGVCEIPLQYSSRLTSNRLSTMSPAAATYRIRKASSTLMADTVHRRLDYNTVEDAALCDIIAATDISSKRSEWTCGNVTNKCSFNGATCSGSNIISLDLSSVGISGTLPSSIGDMTMLTNLDMQSNSLDSSLPSSLGQLTSLVTLSMYGNFLSGPLPSSIGNMTALTYVSLSDNPLGSTLPSSIGRLTSLVSLSLFDSSLTGSLPSSIGDMTALTYLTLQSNSLNNSLPSSLGQLTSLEVLNLNSNSFTGPLPDSFSSLSKLEVLNVEDNLLTGVYPSELCAMTQLTSFYLTQTTYHECVRPTSTPTPFPTLDYNTVEDAALCDIIAATDISSKRSEWTCGNVTNKCSFNGATCSGSNIISLDLSSVGISGTLPSSIGDMTMLTYLKFVYNSLDSSLPSSLGQLTSLEVLNLDSNSLTGPLPSSIGDMTALTFLDIGLNSLDNTLPSSLGQLTLLRHLYIASNSFTGSLPSSIVDMTSLTFFNVASNSLSSCLLSSLGELTSIVHLHLYGNSFTGRLPASIGDMAALTYMNIAANSLNSTLPSSLGQLTSLANLQLYYNFLTGPLPSSIGDMTALTFLHIGINSLDSALPSSLGQLTSLAALEMQSNSLTGSLPSSIGDMAALSSLYLNSNSLNNSLPSSLGQLTSLEVLYLNSNSFTGPLPDSFSSLSKLEVLNVEDNLLTGVYPSELCAMTQLTSFYLTQTTYHECVRPTSAPTSFPSGQPSGQPTGQPSGEPTVQPSGLPSGQPSCQPTRQPTSAPSGLPSGQPSCQPTGQPTSEPTGQPTSEPSGQPTVQPSGLPTGQPTSEPTGQPTSEPSGQPTVQPSGLPSGQPSCQPTGQPTCEPTGQPTVQPSGLPSGKPSGLPTGQPTSEPTGQPTSEPSGQPTVQPSGLPSGQPSCQPTGQPTCEPTGQPTVQPSGLPSGKPSGLPTGQPTSEPTGQPTSEPSGQPTVQPSGLPSGQPSCQPTGQPTCEPTGQPTVQPSGLPSGKPSSQPTGQPTIEPSGQPTVQPSSQPTGQPTSAPSGLPSGEPTTQPSSQPTGQPSGEPTVQPSSHPTGQPSSSPSCQPTGQPTSAPSGLPSGQPSGEPTVQPSSQPTGQPTSSPSGQPTGQPTSAPSGLPTGQPSREPTAQPSSQPTGQPSGEPTMQPSFQPTGQPTSSPSGQPTGQPTSAPSGLPSGQPSGEPTAQPSSQPTGQPSGEPTMQPSFQPTGQPTSSPSGQPTGQPTSAPSGLPSGQPSREPTAQPSSQPTGQPTSAPSGLPSGEPTTQPSSQPTGQPSGEPTVQPSSHPTGQPSSSPSCQPTGQPTSAPSGLPSGQPSGEPTVQPSSQPTGQPTSSPSGQPTGQPTSAPSGLPTGQPSREPTAQPSSQPTGQPSGEPTMQPSFQPTGQPTSSPSGQPTGQPTSAPSGLPSGQPSGEPTAQPSSQPTGQPSGEPTMQPSFQPTGQPTSSPSGQPTGQPTSAPSGLPSGQPSREPTAQPSSQPTGQPSGKPTGQPSCQPTGQPTSSPSGQPTGQPTSAPSGLPSGQPSREPTVQPSCQPTGQPSGKPTGQPSSSPSCQPTGQPTSSPSGLPSGQPSGEPTTQPSSQPTGQPSVQPTGQPSGKPTGQPTSAPSGLPSGEPIVQPSSQPTGQPSGEPTTQPSSHPTGQPSRQPSMEPSLPEYWSFPSTFAPSLFPSPDIMQIDWTAYRNRVTLSIQLSDRGYVYCAMFKSMEIPDSVSAVIAANNYDYVGNAAVDAVITITSLMPSTNYTLYCVAKHDLLIATSYEEMLSNALFLKTLCCKSIFVDLNMFVLQEQSVGWNLVALTLSAAPSQSSDVRLSVEVTNSSGSYSSFPFLTDTVTVTPSSWSKTHLFTVADSAPGLYTLQVAMMVSAVQQEYDVVFRSGHTFIVETIAAEPSTPRLTSAQFSKSGESATLKFDSPTDKAGYSSYFKCSLLLNVAGAASSDCLWTSATTLTVYFKGSLLPEVGDTVVLLRNTLRAQCTSAASECTGWATVNRTEMIFTPPSDPISPTLVVTYPKVSGLCDSPVIDMTASSGSGGRPWKHFNITVTSASDTVDSLQIWLAENYVISPPPAIPAQLLQGGYRYIFELWLCNFLDECSSTNVIIKSVNDNLPYVSIVGQLSRQINTYTPLLLQSNAFLADCDGSVFYSNLNYDWKIFESEAERSGLVSLSSDARKFKLPPYSLNVSSVYEVKLSVTNSLSGLSSSAEVYVSVVPANIVAVIGGGSQQSLPIGGSVLLDASDSYDEDVPPELRPHTNYSGFEFRWTCMQLLPALLLQCDDLNMQSNVTTPYLLRIFTTNNTMVNSEYSIAVKVLSVADGRQAESSVVVRVAEALAPIVSIGRDGVVSSINPSSSLVLMGTVQLTVVQSAFWTINEPSVDLASRTSTATNASLSKGLHSMILVVSAGSIPGRSVPYVFTLTCGSSTASLEVTFNIPPQPGFLSVFPSLGIAWDTTFTLTAESWSDEDLPLSYIFGYVEGGQYPVVRSRMEISYTSSTFPIGDSTNGHALLCYVSVVDSLDAVSRLQTSVVVRSNTALSATLASEKFQLELESSGNNIDLTKRILSLSSSYLNTKNCSLAPNCTDINRHECFSVDHTCGSCLAGYVGEEGASNHGCVSESDLSEVSPGAFCDADSDCSVWEYCKITESPPICDYLLKTCTSNCSHRGTCLLQDSDNGAAVSECRLIDSSCEAKCHCDQGFSGLFCEYTAEEADVRIIMRESNLRELDGVTRVDDPTEESIMEWQQNLVALTVQSNEISEVGAVHGLNVADMVLSGATLLTLDTYETYSDTLTAVDNIAIVSTNSFLSASTSSSITHNYSRLLINESAPTASRVASVLDMYGSIVRRALIEGQHENRILRKSFQQITEVFSSSDHNEDISVTVPHSFAKTVAGLLPSSIQFLRNSTLQPLRSMKVSLSSIRSQLYDNENYNSDVLQLAFDGLIHSNDSFKVIIQNNYPINYGRLDASNATFNVTCDHDIYTTHSIPCHPSAVNFICNNTAAEVQLRCPYVSSEPQCRVLSSRGSFNCTVDSYTAWNTTCMCRLTSLGYHFGGDTLSSNDANHSSQRRVDETGQEQAILRDSGYVELVSTSEYVADDFIATVVLAQQFDSPEDLREVLVVVSLFGTIWGVGFIAMCYMFAMSTHTSKREKLKQCATSPSPDIDSASRNAIVVESMKVRLLSYVKEVFPAVYNTESSWSRLWRELKSHHRYIALILSKDFTNTVDHRIRVLLHLLTTLSMLMFFLALLYDFEYPEDNGNCEAHITEEQCATEKSMLDSSQRVCRWVEDDDTIRGYSCVFVSPEITLKAIMIASVICSIFSMFGNAIVDFIFDILAAPTASRSRQNAAAVHRSGQIQRRVSLLGTRVSAIATIVSDQFRSSVGTKKKTPSFLTTESTRHLPYSCIAAQQLASSSLSNIVAEVNPSLQIIERRSRMIQRLNSRMDTPHPQSISVQSNSGPCPQSQQTEGVGIMAANPSAILSISSDDLYDDLCSDIAEQMKYLRTARQKEAFMLAWCLGSKDQFKPEYATAIKEALKGQLAFVKKEVAQKLNKLHQIEEIYIGLELLHMFVLDVLGKASPAAKIFETKSEEEFRHTYVVSKFVKGIMWALVVLLNFCFVFYSMLRGLQRGLEWQMMFLFACIVQFVFEIVLYESSEVTIIHFVIPSLVRYEVMAAQTALYNAIESISNMSEETNDVILDTPQYLFVSTNVAKFFPHLLESAIVRSYHSVYPGAIARNWNGSSRVNYRSGAVVRSGRTYTKRFSVIALISLLVQKLGAVNSTWQRMIIHLLQPLFAVSLLMMWQYMWYHPVYFIVPLLFTVYIGYCYFLSWKKQAEERSVNKVGQRPSLVSPDDASSVPGVEGIHHLNTDNALLATEEGNSSHHLRSDPIHHQRQLNGFPSIVEKESDTTIVPPLPSTALPHTADTCTEAAAVANTSCGDSDDLRPVEETSPPLAPDDSIAGSDDAHLQVIYDFSSDNELEVPDIFNAVFGNDYDEDDSSEFEL